MALRAVTFDLWGTLLFDSAEAEARRNGLRVEATARLLGRWGHPHSHEAVSEAFEQARRVWARLRRLHTELSFRQKMVTLLATLDPALLPALTSQQVEELAMAHARAFFESPPDVAPDAAAVLREIAGHGLRLGIISNTGVTPGFAVRRLLQSAGFGNLFSAQTYSDELGAGKPARAAFQVTLHRLAVGPHEAVHIGDDPKLDVLGGKAAGMRVVLLGPLPIPAAEEQMPGGHEPDAVARDLFETLDIIRRMAEGE